MAPKSMAGMTETEHNRGEIDTVALQRRAARGSALALLNYSLVMGINLVTTLILASKLGREEFGLVGIAFSIQSLLLTLRDGGFANALIQKKDITDDHINSVFWLNVVVAVVVSTVLILLAQPVATFYGQPLLKPILYLMPLAVFGHALGGVQDAQLRKNIRFDKLLWVDFFSISIASLVAIIAIYLGAGVWSLVFRLILGPLLYAVFCWIASPWRPKFVFRWGAIRSLWSFGSYLFFSSLLGYGLTQLDNPLVGKLVGMSAAGMLFLARQLIVRTMMSIAQSVSRVMFPVFSVIQNDPATIRAGYFTGTRCLALIIYAMVAGVFALSPEAVPLVLGDEWLAIVPVLQVMSLQGLLICVNLPASQILIARGKSKVIFWLSAGRGVIVLASFVVGCQWGILGVAICWTAVRYMIGPFALWLAVREVQITPLEVLRNITRPLIAAIVSALAVRILVAMMLDSGQAASIGLLALEVVLGLGVYSLCSLFLLHDTVRKIFRDLSKARSPQGS